MLSIRLKYIIVLTLFTLYNTILFGQKPSYVQGEYIVEVKQDKDLHAFLNNHHPPLGARNQSVQAHQIASSPLNVWLIKVDSTSVNEQEFERSLRSNQNFTHVSKNKIITPRNNPNDALFSRQWQYINTGGVNGALDADIDMDLAWDITTGGTSALGDTIVVCVIDDGINATHEDMKDNIWTNRHEIANNGIDDDNNGYIDDFKGWNVIRNNDDVFSGGSHGTPVAGIVGARGNNNIGVSGVNWNVKLMIVNYGIPNEANAIASYSYVYQMRKMFNESNGEKGAFVVATNASWGIDNSLAEDSPLWCEMYNLLGSVGVLNCGATSNLNNDVDAVGDMPTSCTSEYLISVTNLNRNDEKMVSAGYGTKSIDVGAYGHQVYTVTSNGYGNFGGTSGATPHVSGLIGLMYSAPCFRLGNLYKLDPAGAALVVKDMILHGVKANNSMNGISTTGGKLNAYRALANLQNLCTPCSAPAGISMSTKDKKCKVSWITNEGNSNISLRYRKVGQSSWIEEKNIKTGYELDNLEFCTEYELQLSSSCGLLPAEYSYSKFFKTDGCCEIPVLTKTERDESTIKIDWRAANYTSFNLEYQGPDLLWKDTTLTDSFFTLNNLPYCTAYTFRIKSSCDQFSTSSTFGNLIEASTACGNCTSNNYCSIPKIDATQEWIDQFSFAGIDYKSGSSKIGYKDFAGKETMMVDVGQKYGFEITPAYAGASFVDFFSIYIDYNQNGFWEAEETVFKTSEPTDQVVRDSIMIPENTVPGYTKLRVVMSYEMAFGPCHETRFEYGEVEDYCIFISDEKCQNLLSLDSVAIKQDQLTFYLNKNESTSDSVLWYFREKGSPTWIKSVGNQRVSIDSLKECTLYEYQYSDGCGPKWSQPSKVETVKTACKNSIVYLEKNFKIYPNPTQTQLTLSLDSQKANSYLIRFFDGTGKVINGISNIQQDDKTSCDVGHLQPGLYFVEITWPNGQKIMKKWVKI